MKKLIACLLSVMLVACGAPKQETTTLKVLVPKGAPALALTTSMTEKEEEYSLVDGTDLLTTEFAKENGDYDLVVAPINLGAKLIQDGKTSYRLAGVVTWGNLYLVADKNLAETDIVTAFGQGAVPDRVMQRIFQAMGYQNNIEYFPSVTDVQAQMLSNQADVALMAEPAASATIAKAKQQERELKIILDFQKEWKNISGTEGYPQAALFVREASYQKYSKQIDALLQSYVKASEAQNADPETLRSKIETLTPEYLGVPSADMAIKTYPRQNIRFVLAKDATADIKAFLEIFNISFEDSFLIK